MKADVDIDLTEYSVNQIDKILGILALGIRSVEVEHDQPENTMTTFKED